MSKQINIRMDFIGLEIIDKLKVAYQTESTTDVIKYALIAACDQLGYNTHDIIIEASKKHKAD